jgi:hypothetical protein
VDVVADKDGKAVLSNKGIIFQKHKDAYYQDCPMK